MAIDDLYERDFYAWTQAQAEALRMAAKGGRPNAIEWERVAEELEDVGKSEYREAASYVALIIEHLFKMSWTARKEPKAGWRSEIIRFRGALEDTLTESLRAKLLENLERLHLRGVRNAAATFAAPEPDAPRDDTLRWSLEQILGERDDPLERP